MKCLNRVRSIFIIALKAETDDIHAIFLLKKNIQINIIKTMLEYPLMAVPEMLREWKVVIILVGQGYESIESLYNYRMGIGTTYEIIATYTNIWQKNARNQRKNKT